MLYEIIEYELDCGWMILFIILDLDFQIFRKLIYIYICIICVKKDYLNRKKVFIFKIYYQYKMFI